MTSLSLFDKSTAYEEMIKFTPMYLFFLKALAILPSSHSLISVPEMNYEKIFNFMLFNNEKWFPLKAHNLFLSELH